MEIQHAEQIGCPFAGRAVQIEVSCVLPSFMDDLLLILHAYTLYIAQKQDFPFRTQPAAVMSFRVWEATLIALGLGIEQ